MNSQNTPHNLKVDRFLPLEIGPYLQDTAHLDTLESGAYLHLLMHYWTNGPLPNNMKQLAIIAKLSPDAWSIVQASLMQFFNIGEDGLLHQAGCDRRLQYWLNKRFKAKEKATKAAMARWGKYKAKIEAKNDAPSIAQAVHMQCPIPIEVQEQKQIPTPPPPAAQEGQDAASSTLRRIEKPRQTPRQAGTAPRQTGRSPRHLGIAPRQAGTAKKTNGKLGPTARRNEVSEGIHPKNTSDAVAVPPNLIAPGAANGVRPMKTTLAPAGFKDEVFRYWEEQNPAGPPCPWDEHEDRALEALLRSSPGITFAMFKQMLSNRAASGIAASILPRKWLRGLMEYLSGSLDRFKHPVAAGRVM